MTSRWNTAWDVLRGKRSVPPVPPPSQTGLKAGSVRITHESALRASAVWAALRLRSNLVSSMPVDAYRMREGVQLEVNPPSVVWVNAGQEIETHEALYNTQFDLDRAGNCFGVITERHGLGLPARIELVNLGDVSVQSVAGKIRYNIGGDTYRPDQVWHERQYTVSGLAMGLCPVAYAAYSVGAYLSAQQFALDWFGNSAMPAVELKNTEKAISPEVAAEAKMRYQAAAEPGGVFAIGADWELKPIVAANNQAQYVEQQQFGIPDIARFFDVPADLIDGAVSGSSVTYASRLERRMEFLITSLGPAILRREKALSRLLPQPRFVKLNTDALLRMTPETRANVIKTQLDSRVLTPTEARALDNRAPLTAADLAEFTSVYGAPRTTPTEATA